jgi:hypothetical protein
LPRKEERENEKIRDHRDGGTISGMEDTLWSAITSTRESGPGHSGELVEGFGCVSRASRIWLRYHARLVRDREIGWSVRGLMIISSMRSNP